VPIEKELVTDIAVNLIDGDHIEVKTAGKGVLLVGIGNSPALLSGWFEDFWKHYNRAAQGLAFAA
jgi:hypothetical protein